MSKEFKEKYYNVFGRVYKFMQDHYGAKTHEDWRAIAEDCGYDKTDFEEKLLSVVVEEIERVFKEGES